jgi:hypothetical protein
MSEMVLIPGVRMTDRTTDRLRLLFQNMKAGSRITFEEAERLESAAPLL